MSQSGTMSKLCLFLAVRKAPTSALTPCDRMASPASPDEIQSNFLVWSVAWSGSLSALVQWLLSQAKCKAEFSIQSGHLQYTKPECSVTV